MNHIIKTYINKITVSLGSGDGGTKKGRSVGGGGREVKGKIGERRKKEGGDFRSKAVR